jgi:histidine ammonia-lyase
MNGTSAMTGLACLAHYRARRLAQLACRVTALVSDAILGNSYHFDARIFELKPHPGTMQAAHWIRTALGPARNTGKNLQDRYSIRCAPHVVGALLDGLSFAESAIEVELNGVNDNPIIPPGGTETLHGGNCYGGHIGLVMDTLKIALASVADLLDRQVALVCNPATNNGLPADLVVPNPPSSIVHHGFKAMQITASALAAEAAKATMPATSFSRSTESHNQDKVSMGTIAARDCLRICELSESVAAIALLAACQATDLRGPPRADAGMQGVYEAVRARVPQNTQDRRQDLDIACVLDLLRTDRLPLAAPPAAQQR